MGLRVNTWFLKVPKGFKVELLSGLDKLFDDKMQSFKKMICITCKLTPEEWLFWKWHIVLDE